MWAVSETFRLTGGSEKGAMSTTANLEVAVQYATSENSVLLKIKTRSFRERGAHLRFISAFPNEEEGMASNAHAPAALAAAKYVQPFS